MIYHNKLLSGLGARRVQQSSILILTLCQPLLKEKSRIHLTNAIHIYQLLIQGNQLQNKRNNNY